MKDLIEEILEEHKREEEFTNKVKAIFKYALSQGWATDMALEVGEMVDGKHTKCEADVFGGQSFVAGAAWWVNLSDVIREPKHKFLKTIYGEHVKYEPATSDTRYFQQKHIINNGWHFWAQRFSTMPIEEVIDELYQYVINLKNNE